MIKELFKLNNDYIVDLNKEWISTIPEFKALLKRDKGSKGDIQGRQKLQVKKEITFIYHYCDFKSQYRDYPDDERWDEALKNAELSESDIDDKVKVAIEKYKDLQKTKSTRLLDAAYKAVDSIREYFENTDLAEKDINDRLVNNPKQFVDNIKSMAGVVKGLQELERMVKEELEEKGRIRGDATRGSMEDPDDMPTFS